MKQTDYKSLQFFCSFCPGKQDSSVAKPRIDQSHFLELTFKKRTFKELTFKELDFKELGVLGYSDLLGLGVLGYSDLLGLGRLFRSIGIGPTISIHWDWAGYSDLLGLGVPKETIRRRLFEGDYPRRLFEGDYSKEWHLVPELWYLNYGT